jgi:hypothetical protein
MGQAPPPSPPPPPPPPPPPAHFLVDDEGLHRCSVCFQAGTTASLKAFWAEAAACGPPPTDPKQARNGDTVFLGRKALHQSHKVSFDLGTKTWNCRQCGHYTDGRRVVLLARMCVPSQRPCQAKARD